MVELVAATGSRAELVIFCDAQDMAQEDRDFFLQALVTEFQHNAAVIFQIANEPFKNGWSGALDSKLLTHAETVASILGHRDFSIGDPQDGDDEDASAETMRECVELAKRSNIIVIHSSRAGDAQPSGERFRRWIDHMEGFYDIIAECHKVNPNAWGCHDEPMGFAAAPQVAGHVRETDPEAALAGELTAQMIGCGFTYHYISFQNDGTPGLDLLSQFTNHLSPDPSWSYRNDSWGGSASHGYTGWGKVRTWTNGAHAVVLASGASRGSITWANGFNPDQTLFDGAHVALYATN